MENTTLKLPKNIRQIGTGDCDYQIYIEDYLMSYLKKRPERDGDIRYGVLLGDVKMANGYTYFFINGAVDVEDVMENTIIFNDEVWTGLYDDINSYFVGNRIVGWFAALNENSNNDMVNIKKIHLDNFAGMDKLFLKLSMDEEDENFYVYENTGLTKQPCYHIYFNKSENMEDYIFGTGKKDKYRKSEIKNTETGKYGILLNNINQKKLSQDESEEKKDTQKTSVLPKAERIAGYARAASIAVLVTVAAGVGMLYKDGKLGLVKNSVENFVAGVFGDEDDKDIGDIISVNGSVKTQLTTAPMNGGEVTTEPIGEVESTTVQQVVESDATTETQTSKDTEESTSAEEETTTMLVETVVEQEKTYIVKEGDTLLSICIEVYQDKSKLDEIIEANNIENPDIVLPGEELILP